MIPNSSQSIAERLRTIPVSHSRTLRPDISRTATSGIAGLCYPLTMIPLYREDGLETSAVSLTAYMQETTNLLINTVNCVFSAWFVPKLAFDRFEGSIDALNRSYLGQQEKDGTVIPWIDDVAYGNAGVAHDFYRAAGLHNFDINGLVNSDYWEAYTKVFEYRCRMRSEALWESVKDTYVYGQLRPAFFDNPQMAIVKPSFDDAMLDGEVPLTVTAAQMPVVGITRRGTGDNVQTMIQNTSPTYPTGTSIRDSAGGNIEGLDFDINEAASNIYAELQQDGISISVANIDLARETAAWARVRSRYQGLDDDDLIDLLMAGVSIPQQYETQPMLLARQTVPFGMSQRYSTEAENLDVSATRGIASTQMRLRMPSTNTGGVIIVLAEVVPEQFWERSRDYWLTSVTETRRPDRLLDELDPQAVEVVKNGHFDVHHTDPNGIGGYAPLNHMAVRRRFNVGGKFHKMDPNAPWSEDRNRIWASEPIDPTLSKEFYLATDLPRDIFMSANEDNFEFSAACDARISGLTYIGPLLREQTGQYDAILERVDLSRISGTPVTQIEQSSAEENDDDQVIEQEQTSEGEEQ